MVQSYGPKSARSNISSPHGSVLARSRLRLRKVTAVDRAVRRKKPVVLVGVSMNETSKIALRRADALARIMGARIVVAHILERLPASRFRHAAADPGARHALASRRIGEWCRNVLGTTRRGPEIIVRDGRVSSGILSIASEQRAVLVVIGARAQQFVAPRLLRESGSPILVARPPRPCGGIVAATDLADDTYPVLRRAAMFGERLGVPVTFVTNVGDSAAPRFDERRALLRAIAQSVGDGIDSKIVQTRRSVDAILDAARTDDVDLVFVGARRALSAPEPGTADAVVGEARRSVLVVPLEPTPG
ncbi:hypothetical protein BH09MYX1_BH09MYX1_06700 [soil metagenome]